MSILPQNVSLIAYLFRTLDCILAQHCQLMTSRSPPIVPPLCPASLSGKNSNPEELESKPGNQKRENGKDQRRDAGLAHSSRATPSPTPTPKTISRRLMAEIIRRKLQKGEYVRRAMPPVPKSFHFGSEFPTEGLPIMEVAADDDLLGGDYTEVGTSIPADLIAADTWSYTQRLPQYDREWKSKKQLKAAEYKHEKLSTPLPSLPQKSQGSLLSIGPPPQKPVRLLKPLSSPASNGSAYEFPSFPDELLSKVGNLRRNSRSKESPSGWVPNPDSISNAAHDTCPTPKAVLNTLPSREEMRLSRLSPFPRSIDSAPAVSGLLLICSFFSISLMLSSLLFFFILVIGDIPRIPYFS